MKTKIKFHDMPGDIPKRDKITMLENKNKPLTDLLGRILPITKSHLRRAKGYKKEMLMRERAILKERFRVRLRDEL